MSVITRQGRALLAVAVAVVAGAVLFVGCGGDSGTNSGGNGGGGGTTPGTIPSTTPGTTPGGGDSYESVVLGGKTWMKKNLDVQTADSWCYENSADSCAKYGRLYTWQAAKSACQSIGWRLPDTADWRRLVEATGGIAAAGSKLKSTSGWYDNGNGTDTYGFSALPGGRRYTGGSFSGAGNYGGWWTATEDGSGYAYYRYMYYGIDRVYEYKGDNDKGYGVSVRCVSDN